MLSKEVKVDKIEVLESGQIQVRQVTTILEDDVEISKAYHRYALSPGDDLLGQDSTVAAIATAAWTKMGLISV